MEPELKWRVLAALGLIACVPEQCNEGMLFACLSPPPEVQPCLSMPPRETPDPEKAPDPEKPPGKDGASLDPAEVRARVLASGVLPPDVVERLTRRSSL